MHDTRILPAVACQFALGCNLTTAYYLLTMNEGLPGWFFPQIMLVYGPGVLLLNRIFLRRERSLLALLVLNSGLLAAVMGAYLLLEPWRGLAYTAFSALFLGWLTFRGCRTAMDGAPLRGTLLTLDAAFLLLVVFVCYSSAAGLPPMWSIPPVIGLCAAVASAVILRSSRSPGFKGWLAVGLAAGALFGLLQLVTGAAAPAGRGLVALWNLIAAGYNAVKALILRFFLFLLSLLPDAEPGEADWMEQGEAIIIESLPEQEGSPVLGTILFLLMAAGLVAGLVWLIRQLRRIRLAGIKTARTATLPKRERISILPALLRLVRGWREAIRLRLFLWRERNSPRGLYFLLVHRCRRAPWHKKSGETPRQFLTRLSEAAAGDEVLSRALTDLAVQTDAAFYAPHRAEIRLEYAALVRRRMGRSLTAHFLRQTAARLSPAKKSP